MDELARQLGSLASQGVLLTAPRVLDLCTGSGSFALRLAEGLGSYKELVAVDSQAKAVAAAAKALEGLPGARALEADASALPFPAASFDLVAMANSLHHVEDPQAVLGEALRVLAPGGHLAILEMHREARDEASLTHVLLHHWWARIDREQGISHRETYSVAALRGLLDGLGLENPTWTEIEGEEQGFEPELLAELGQAITTYLGRIPPASPRKGELTLEGWALRERVARHGFRSAPALFFLGRAPGRP